MDPAEAAARWRATWIAAWPAGDAEAVVALYAEDAVHRSTPFRPPHVGRAGLREYFVGSFAAETAPATVVFDEPLVSGHRAVMEWWAQVTEAGGPATIAGIAVADFGPDGLIVGSRDYWHAEAGHLRRWPAGSPASAR
jgi:uncharacterized protein (TIGR02246 family)